MTSLCIWRVSVETNSSVNSCSRFFLLRSACKLLEAKITKKLGYSKYNLNVLILKGIKTKGIILSFSVVTSIFAHDINFTIAE